LTAPDDHIVSVSWKMADALGSVDKFPAAPNPTGTRQETAIPVSLALKYASMFVVLAPWTDGFLLRP